MWPAPDVSEERWKKPPASYRNEANVFFALGAFLSSGEKERKGDLSLKAENVLLLSSSSSSQNLWQLGVFAGFIHASLLIVLIKTLSFKAVSVSVSLSSVARR